MIGALWDILTGNKRVAELTGRLGASRLQLEASRALLRNTAAQLDAARTNLKAVTINRDALDQAIIAAANIHRAKVEDLESTIEDLRATVARMEAEVSSEVHEVREQLRLKGLHVVTLQQQLEDAGKRIKGHKDELDREEKRIRAELGFKPIIDKKGQLDAGNNAQAARAMARNMKADFVAYQEGVKRLLDELNTLGKKNHITKEDLRKFGEIRKAIGHEVGRSI